MILLETHIKSFILNNLRYIMNINFSFWIRENEFNPIYRIDKSDSFYLYEIEDDHTSYIGNHPICEQLLNDFNIPTTLNIAETLHEIRSIPR